MGRNKIQIRPLTNERNRQATFTKRKQGLLKKAMEFSILCGCQVSLLIVHENKLYEYSSHDMQQVLEEYPAYEKAHDSLSNDDYETNFGDKSKKKADRPASKETTPPKSSITKTANPTASYSFFCANPSAPSVGQYRNGHNGHHEVNDGRYYGNVSHSSYPPAEANHGADRSGPLTPVSTETIKQANLRLAQIMEKQDFSHHGQYSQREMLHSSMPSLAHPEPSPHWPRYTIPEMTVTLSDNVTAEPERSRPSRKRPREELRITVPQNKKARAPVRLENAGALLEENKPPPGNTVPPTPEFPSLGPSVSLTTEDTTQRIPKKTSPLPLTPLGCTTLPSWPWTPTPKEVSSTFTNFEFESPKQRPCLSQHGYL